MKQVITFIAIHLVSYCLFAQGGTITSITMEPNSPSSTDTIYFYASLQFTSGDCELDYATYNINGSSIQAHANHCVGLLAVICPAIDTFKINPLPAGNYEFNFTLTSGAAPTPCTPGIVPDDSSTFSFTIDSAATAKVNNMNNEIFGAYPNPIHDHVTLPSIPDGTTYSLFNVSGQVVKSGWVHAQRIENLTTLPSGLYILKLNSVNNQLIKQLIKQ